MCCFPWVRVRILEIKGCDTPPSPIHSFTLAHTFWPEAGGISQPARKLAAGFATAPKPADDPPPLQLRQHSISSQELAAKSQRASAARQSAKQPIVQDSRSTIQQCQLSGQGQWPARGKEPPSQYHNVAQSIEVVYADNSMALQPSRDAIM